jgi:hypothetical protein
MSLNDVVNLQISRSAAAVSRQGFGTMLILGTTITTEWGADRIRSYTSAAALLEDGFATSDAEYKAALVAFSQDLKPTRVKVGRRLTPVAQVITVTPTAANTYIYSVTINDTEFSFTSDGSATAAEIVTGLIALINAGSEPVTASGTSTLILTADEAGVSFTVTLGGNLSKVTSVANVGIATDLAEVSEEDDDWYALVSTSRDPDVIMEAAAYIESVRKIYIACSGDAGVIAAGSTDVASLLKAKAYARTAYLYSGNQAAMPEAAWLGGNLPDDPGSATYKFKTLTGVTADDLTSTQYTVAKAKNANIYTTVGGAGMTEEGVMAEGEFIDVIIGIDWLHSNMQADVFQVLRDQPKVPYTDAGVATIETAVRNRLRLAVLANVLAEDPAPVVTVPKVADVAPSDKAARLLKDVTFTATLAGAVHAVEITGNVSV